MRATDWNKIICDMLDQTERFIKELTYARTIWREASKRLAVEEAPDNLQTSMTSLMVRTFSIAHQRHKDLLGIVNLTLPTDLPARAVEAYLKQVGRSVGTFDALSFAATEAHGWDHKDEMNSYSGFDYIVIYGCDRVCNDYRNLSAFIMGLERFNPLTQGAILVSETALDEYPPVLSKGLDKTRSPTDIAFEVIDPLAIVSETLTRKNNGHT